MDPLHHEVDLGADDAIEVELDRQANVLLLDEATCRRFRGGGS
jgi:predicted nucleic acid-binding protein